jgi:cytochrome c
MDSRLVGPALKEAAALYRGNPEGIVTWALQPGRRRPDYPPMPPQQVPRDELLQIANYIVDTVTKQ